MLNLERTAGAVFVVVVFFFWLVLPPFRERNNFSGFVGIEKFLTHKMIFFSKSQPRV